MLFSALVSRKYRPLTMTRLTNKLSMRGWRQLDTRVAHEPNFSSRLPAYEELEAKHPSALYKPVYLELDVVKLRPDDVRKSPSRFGVSSFGYWCARIIFSKNSSCEAALRSERDRQRAVDYLGKERHRWWRSKEPCRI